jgi:uncharacterized protein YbjT (DUF2867 family)
VYLVSGATGNVGAEVVRALAGAGEQVRALTRATGSARLPAGAEPVVGDLNRPESLAEALRGVRGVFLLAGYADMPGLLRAVRDAGVEHVVLLSSGAVAGGDVANAVVRYNVVSEAAVYDAGVRATILRPSGFHSNALRWLPQLNEGDVIREAFAGVPVAYIDPFDIAAVAALALTRTGEDQSTAVTAHRLTGPAAITSAERMRVLARVLGRELTLVPLSDAEAREEMSRGMPPQYVEAFFSFFADGTYDDSRVEPTVQHLLGRPPRTFEQWTEAHADDFRPTAG